MGYQKILVCGGRDYADQAKLFRVLDMESTLSPVVEIIQGGASGADKLAREWAIARQCRYSHYPADWNAHGRAAGPIRNQQMLVDGKPTKVIAFPGGRGTADMVRRARAAGVETIVIPHTQGAEHG